MTDKKGLTGFEWEAALGLGAGVAVPWFLQVEAADWLFVSVPAAVVTYLLFGYLISKDPVIVENFNGGLTYLKKHLIIFLIEWTGLTMISAWAADKVLDILEPVLDIFEIVMPDGMDLAWLLSPYSPRFMLLFGVMTFLVTLYFGDDIEYTINAAQWCLWKFFGWTSMKPKVAMQELRGAGGRNDQGGAKSNYGLSFIYRDIFQFMTCYVACFSTAVAQLLGMVQYPSDDSWPKKIFNLLTFDVTAMMYAWHKAGDILFDIYYFNHRFGSACFKGLIDVTQYTPVFAPTYTGAVYLGADDIMKHCT